MGEAEEDQRRAAAQSCLGRRLAILVDEREGAFASEDEADAGKAEKLEGGNGDHGRTYTFQPE
jgi:hypothetical protein